MDIEDLAPKPVHPLAALAREDLGTLSVDELGARIEALKAEIVRVEQAMVAKKHSLHAADAFFRKT